MLRAMDTEREESGRRCQFIQYVAGRGSTVVVSPSPPAATEELRKRLSVHMHRGGSYQWYRHSGG